LKKTIPTSQQQDTTEKRKTTKLNETTPKKNMLDKLEPHLPP
jgi:hypothetical protein